MSYPEAVELRTGGRKVYQRPGGAYQFISGFTIDADGSPRAYHPKGHPPGLDRLGNAGTPGNWWALATNKKGVPFVQKAGDPAPGYFVSTTSFQNEQYALSDPRRYLDSEAVNFIVLPQPWRHILTPVVLGCYIEAEHCDGGDTISGVVADFGPATHLGEGSIALARALGINADPIKGGVTEGIVYRVYPGRPAPGYELKPLRL
ncbi:MAG TPA: hypothetical protein VK961_06940 [Chthoniobacter sp.]|nr:hypothetical protein [Chthoniobacter sp.]